MNKIFKTIRFVFILLVITVIMGCNRNSLPKIETADNFKDISWAEFLSDDFGYTNPKTKGQSFLNGDELLSIGMAQCSTDSASIEAAKYWAISGLARGILLDEPEDLILSYWPDMVYELSSFVQVKIRNLAKTTNGQVYCLVSIKKNEADKLKDNLWKRWEILAKPILDTQEHILDIEALMNEAFERANKNEY
jgi:hypothetical protein